MYITVLLSAKIIFQFRKGISMRVLMTGGGTGGHVNPAIAIADYIRRMEPDSEIAFVGTSRGIENKLVPNAGYPLHHVEIQGLKRSLSLSNLKTAWLTVTSVGKAKKLIKAFKPDIVVGTGGYVSWPVVKAASQMGIPTALHESNAIPGMAVKMLEGSVDKLFVNFEESKRYLKYPEKAMRTGNPLKGDFKTLSREEAHKVLGLEGKYRSLILSYGGSMGAERVNDEVLALMRDFTAKNPDIRHVHAAGAIEFEAATAKFREYGLDACPNIELREYIYDMPLMMAAADLVICRAGAMTLSELAMQRKPCILIPSPNVTNNHQYKNAHVLEEKGAASLIEEKNLGEGALMKEVSRLIRDRSALAGMSEKIAVFSIENAGEIIYNELKNLVKADKM